MGIAKKKRSRKGEGGTNESQTQSGASKHSKVNNEKQGRAQTLETFWTEYKP